MGDFEEALTVHWNFSLLIFFLYIRFKREIAAASEPNYWEWGGFLAALSSSRSLVVGPSVRLCEN